jgi:DnaA-homolog protein
MKQLALDMGLTSGPTLASFVAGPNAAVASHLGLWVGGQSNAATRSPVPTYLWGSSASGKTHLLKAAREALREQGALAGWLDATVQEPPDFNEAWAAVLLDDVHLYTAVQQQAAFNWFVNAQTAGSWRRVPCHPLI